MSKIQTQLEHPLIVRLLCTILFCATCVQKQHMPARLSAPSSCMIPDLPGWDATERRPFGGIGPFIYIGRKT